MELETNVTVAFILWFSVSFQALRIEEGYVAFNEETAFALSSLQDMPFSTSSAIYSACWIEFLVFHKDLRGSVSSQYLGKRA